MKKIITTVGTSVFTNTSKYHEDEEFRRRYEVLEENFRIGNWNDEQDSIERLRDDTKGNWQNRWDDSAEIKSICAIADKLKEDVEVYLLATDTVLSVLACLLIMEWFEKNHNKSQFSVTFKAVDNDGKDVSLTKDNRENLRDELVVKDLRVMSDSSSSSTDKIDDATINSGFLNLIDKIQAIIKPGQKKREGFILNISGGYKAFIPVLTIMGQLYNIPLKYIYEGSDRLVSIDQFPINFDWGIVDLLMPYLKDLSSVQQPEKVIAQLEKFHLVTKEKDDYVQSPMGKLLKKFYEAEMPTSRKVIGPYMEYKLYEYFQKYHRNAFDVIERSVPLEYSGQKAEIDLELSKGKEVFACEVKPFNQVQNHFDTQILEPAKSRVPLYKNNQKNLKGYILFFYKLEGQPIESVLVNNLTRIKSSLQELGVEFKACYLNLPLTKNNDGVNYERFMQHALKREELREIDLDKSTSSKIVEDTFKL